MSDAVSWATPLLLLPGVGLLLVSTSARYEAVHEEIHRLLDEASAQAAACARHAVRRAGILRTALLSLYTSAALLAGGGLCGAISASWLALPGWLSFALSAAAVVCILVAAVALIREASVSLDIITQHARELDRSKAQVPSVARAEGAGEVRGGGAAAREQGEHDQGQHVRDHEQQV